MYEEHDELQKLEDLTRKIWRFMDFEKFVSLIETNSLFFCRSNILDDSFEGALTEPEVSAAKQSPELTLYDEMISKAENSQKKERLKFAKNLFKNAIIDLPLFLRQSKCINCWSIQQYESAALWNYTATNQSVALQSSIQKLVDCFRNTKQNVYINPISYLDFKNDTSQSSSILPIFFRKRKSFESENELRAVVTDMDTPLDKIGNDKGIFVKIDLTTLIEKIYVSPKSSPEFKSLIQDILSKHNLNFSIEDSELSKRPELR